MGKYFIDAVDTTRVNFEDSQWVDIKTELTQQDRDTILTRMARTSAAAKEGDKEAQASIELKLGSMALLERSVVAWSFTDDEGKPVPVTPDNISRLRGKYRTPLLEKINALDAEAKKFVKN